MLCKTFLHLMSILAAYHVQDTLAGCLPLKTPNGSQQIVCSGNGFAVGTQCFSTCLPNYFRPEGNADTTMCARNGEWTHELTACVDGRCRPWSEWSSCNWCTATGQGNATRVRICEQGRSEWEWKVCEDGCAECGNQEELNVAVCECEADGDDGIALQTSKCTTHQGFVLERGTLVSCQCKGCHSSPCKHMGTCISSDNKSYTCSCVDLYEGINCETPRMCSPLTCYNTGRCVVLHGDRMCACPPLMTGHFCLSKSNCGRWESFGCPSCGHWFEVRLCFENGKNQVHIRNFSTPLDGPRITDIGAISQALLYNNLPSESGVKCEWSRWSECDRMTPKITNCTQTRHYICHDGEYWLPINHTWHQVCKCPAKRTLLIRDKWTEWQAWKVTGIFVDFMRQERIEVRWIGGEQRVDEIFSVKLCSGGHNYTKDMPRVGELLVEPTPEKPKDTNVGRNSKARITIGCINALILSLFCIIAQSMMDAFLIILT